MLKREEFEVTITSRRDVAFPTVEGGQRVEVWVNYRYGHMPPGLVKIPKKEYTAKKEKAEIKADIQARLKKKPETLKV